MRIPENAVPRREQALSQSEGEGQGSPAAQLQNGPPTHGSSPVGSLPAQLPVGADGRVQPSALLSSPTRASWRAFAARGDRPPLAPAAVCGGSNWDARLVSPTPHSGILPLIPRYFAVPKHQSLFLLPVSVSLSTGLFPHPANRYMGLGGKLG